MRTFKDDDAGYTRWLENNPTGYVLNCRRGKGESFKLHRANCKYVESPKPSRRMTTKYYKVCSNDKAYLKKWARNRISYCPACFAERFLHLRRHRGGDWVTKDDQVFLFDRDAVKMFRVEKNGERVEIESMDDVAHILLWGQSISVEKAIIVLGFKD